MSTIQVCDFCGKTSAESTPADLLITGNNGVCVCNLCVEQHAIILKTHKESMAQANFDANQLPLLANDV